MNQERRIEIAGDADVSAARATVRAAMASRDADVAYAAEVIVSELVANAVLHGEGVASVVIIEIDGGVRLEVSDHDEHAPLVAIASSDSMTGRGLALVSQLASRWGVERVANGKTVWAEIDEGGPAGETLPQLGAWIDEESADDLHVRVALGEVPTGLLTEAKRHIDNVAREFALAARGGITGASAPVAAPLADLIERVVHRFEDARREIKRQATEAARAGHRHTHLELTLSLDAADAAEEYLNALDEVDAYSRANRLLTLETPPQHRVFRRWYIGEIVKQVRAAADGLEAPRVVSFEECLLAEVDAAEQARRSSDRAARLYAVAVALASAVTPEEVATAVLTEGVEALGASGGGVLLATAAGQLAVPGTIGYDQVTIDKLRAESRDAELPAAFALRTGEAVWLETVEERDQRFPALRGFEPETIAMCAVPLVAPDRVLGALRFSFSDRRLFDADEQRFVSALAAEASEALQRAQLYEERSMVASALQQSLLPTRLPVLEGADVAAAYNAAGHGVGGDFYDIFHLNANRWGLAIGDVRGRGPEAAAVTALARYTIRTAALLHREPAEVLGVVNEAIHRDEDDERFCSAVFAILELRDDGATLTYANAGHPPPILVRTEGQELLPPTGPLAGLFSGSGFVQSSVELSAGETLVLYTDGISEARRAGVQFGDGPLFETLDQLRGGSAAAIAAGLSATASDYAQPAATDDSAVLVVVIG